MKNLFALLALTRPINGLITMGAVAVGALTSAETIALFPLLKAALSAALINGAGNAFNDLTDIDIDRINRPYRPLPSGRISPRSAQALTALLNLLGILLAFSLSPLHGLLAIIIATLLILYSIFLKNTVLWGNMLIGLISAAAFIYGALSQHAMGRAWIPAAFALLFHIGREIVKDIEDMSGDRLRGEKTLPLYWGRTRAAQLAGLIYLGLIILTFFPFILGTYALVYLLCVSLADALVLYVLYRLYRERADLQHDLLGRLLKIGMLAGLLAIVAGELSQSPF